MRFTYINTLTNTKQVFVGFKHDWYIAELINSGRAIPISLERISEMQRKLLDSVVNSFQQPLALSS